MCGGVGIVSGVVMMVEVLELELGIMVGLLVVGFVVKGVVMFFFFFIGWVLVFVFVKLYSLC